MSNAITKYTDDNVVDGQLLINDCREPEWQPEAWMDEPSLRGDDKITVRIVYSMSEWMATHDRGPDIPAPKPSHWQTIDVIPFYIIAGLGGFLLVMLVLTGVMALMGAFR